MKALKFIFLLLLIHLIASTICFGQSINSYKNKQRHGKWIIYYSDSTKQIDNSGRYRKGVPKGIWRYYDANGKIIRKEKFRFNKIYTTHYHSNGKIKKQGKARITVTDTLSHFFYYGYWNVYDSTGVLIKKQLYNISNIYNIFYYTNNCFFLIYTIISMICFFSYILYWIS